MMNHSSPEKAKVWSGKSGGDAEGIEDADEDCAKSMKHGQRIETAVVCE